MRQRNALPIDHSKPGASDKTRQRDRGEAVQVFEGRHRVNRLAIERPVTPEPRALMRPVDIRSCHSDNRARQAQVADYVMHTEIEQMVGDAGTFARRHPMATLAVTVAAGLAASQLLHRQPAKTRAKTSRKARPRRTSASTSGKRSAQTRRTANGHAHA
jgi:hypothetical protein